MARKKAFAGPAFPRPAQPTGGLRPLCAGIATALLLIFAGAFRAESADHGLLEVRVKDHREAIGDFSSLTLKLGRVAVSPKPGLAFWRVGWRELSPIVQAIDLTRYTGNKTVTVFKGMVGAGAFDAIQLKLDGIEGILKKSQRQAVVKNILAPIKLSFSVEPKGETIIVLDLVLLDMSDHPPRGYELGIKGYELYLNGNLVDKIPPG